MGRFGQIAGLVLLIIGGSLASWGAPYYMLDWGGTFVMTGIALASAGLSCVLLGTVLIKLAGLRADMTALRASVAVSAYQSALEKPEPKHNDTITLAAGMRDTTGVDPGGALSGPPSGAIAGVAVAGAAAGGLAVAAKSILTSVKSDAVPDDTVADDRAVAGAEHQADPVPDRAEKADGLTAGDRASLDDLLSRLAMPSSDKTSAPYQNNAGDTPPVVVDLGTGEPDRIPVSSDSSHADSLFARIDDATSSLKQEAEASTSKPLTKLGQTVDPAPRESLVVERSMEQRIDDEFANLRAELSVASDRPPAAAPVLIATVPDAPAEEAPDPVTLTLDDETGDNAAEETEVPTAEAAESAAWQPPAQAVLPPEMPQETPQETPPDTPAADVAPDPASSSEGVVAAYNVGDTSYAMFVDGRIRVSTPEGQFMLGSMNELKQFMAERRASS